ncbi:hypothetical protein TGAM01_v210217, partial [Trichoderma gamsii]
WIVDDSAPEGIPAAKKTSRTSQKGSQGQSSKAKTSSKNGRSRVTGIPNSERASKGSKSATPSVSNAKRNIQGKADELLHLIETQVEGDPSNLGSCSTATESKMTPRRKDMIDLEHESISKGSNTIYQKSCEHLQSLRGAVDEYTRLNNAKANLTKPSEVEQWKHDSTDIAQVNKRALEIAKDGLNGMVLGERRANLYRSPAPSVDDEVDQAASRWLQTGIQRKGNTWGDAARDALEAISGIVKILS